MLAEVEHKVVIGNCWSAAARLLMTLLAKRMIKVLHYILQASVAVRMFAAVHKAKQFKEPIFLPFWKTTYKHSLQTLSFDTIHSLLLRKWNPTYLHVSLFILYPSIHIHCFCDVTNTHIHLSSPANLPWSYKKWSFNEYRTARVHTYISLKGTHVWYISDPIKLTDRTVLTL